VSEVINNYDRSEVIDPLTVKFYFKKPSPGFLQGTATIGSGLVSLSTLRVILKSWATPAILLAPAFYG
jgi:peptide/nickel transport system substrate-binding protein